MSSNFTDTDQIIQDILDHLMPVPNIHVEDIPNIDLYMDQVTTFMEDHLSHTKRSGEEKVLTKTMINNYAKNKLLPPPEKKKYNRQHMLLLIFIYYLKGFLSLQDIQSLLKPMQDEYYQNDNGLDVTDIYRCIMPPCEGELQHVKDEINRIWEQAKDSSSDCSEKDALFLQIFTAISILSIDVLLKKSVIEKLIDAYTDQQKEK